MSSYNSVLEVWKKLGVDAYTKVRSENIGTGSGSLTTYQLDHQNVISASDSVTFAGNRTASFQITGSTIPDVTGYYFTHSISTDSTKPNTFVRSDGAYYLYPSSTQRFIGSTPTSGASHIANIPYQTGYTITGTLSPDVTGDYLSAGTYGGQAYYTSSAGTAKIWYYTTDWIVSPNVGSPGPDWWWSRSAGGGIEGVYNTNGTASGSLTVSLNTAIQIPDGSIGYRDGEMQAGLWGATGTGSGRPYVLTSAASVSHTGSTSYSIDYDEGSISALATSGDTLSANYNYGDIPDSTMQQILNEADDELEYLTGRNFDLTTTTEYVDAGYDQKTFWTRFYPVVSITSSVNTSSVLDAPSWSASTEGLGNDYLMDSRDKEIGKLEYIENGPEPGQKKLKLVYSYGYSTIPSIVKELHALLSIRKMVNSAVYKALFKGRDDFSPTRLEEIENRIKQLTAMLRKQNISRI